MFDPSASDPSWNDLDQDDWTWDNLVMLAPANDPIDWSNPQDSIEPWEDEPIPIPDQGEPIAWEPAPVDPGPGSQPDLEPIPLPPPPVSQEPPTLPTIKIVAVDPANEGKVVSGMLDSIAVTFNVPLASDGFSASSFRLERLGSNGRVEVIFDQANPPSARLSEDGSQLILIPGRLLVAGEYRLTLSGTARFVSEKGNILDGNGIDLVLTEFRVIAAPAVTKPPVAPKPVPPKPTPPAKPVGVSLKDAKSLGTIGPELIQVAGTLNLKSNPAAVQLYRVELAPNHLWRLGLEISAGRLGSPLLSRLSLFDASGRLIRTETLGMLDAPTDPFLFVGLKPGTYYVGISGAENNPATGGYDLVTGAVAADLPSQQGGEYTISIVADVADTPTVLTGLVMDRADPADPVPTGLTLHFDGPLRLDQASESGIALAPIEIVDASGKVWRTVLASTNESGSSLSLLFLERLPRGRYEVRLSESGGLTDLIGRAPEAKGQEAGVLGRFEITTEPSSRHPNDLGAMKPLQIMGGIERSVDLLPGSATMLRLVITFQADYELTLNDPGGNLTIELIGPDGRINLGSDPQAINGMIVELRPGTYYIRVVNPTSRLIDGFLKLRALWAPLDSVPLNGVGQGPALGMRLTAPVAGLPQVGFDPTPWQATLGLGEATVSPSFERTAGTISVGSGFFSTAMIEPGKPVGPMVTPEILPIGFPTAESMRIVAISPDRGDALAATASLIEGAGLAQFVPIGVGQSVERKPFEVRRVGAPDTGSGSRTEAEMEQGGDLAQSFEGEPGQIRPVSSEAVDVALAMLSPTVSWLPGGRIANEQAGVDANPTTPVQETEPFDDRAEVSLLRAVGIGLAVGCTARYWSRRKHEGAEVQDRAGMSRPGVRFDKADRLESIDELIRRHPGSPLATRVSIVTGN